MVIGFCLINGLLYMMSLGLSVIVFVSVVWCVILFESLLGIKYVVLCSLIVFNFSSIKVLIMVLLSLVCLCNG